MHALHGKVDLHEHVTEPYAHHSVSVITSPVKLVYGLHRVLAQSNLGIRLMNANSVQP